MGDPVVDRATVKRRRLEAAEELSMLLGDTTACAIAKDGRSYPAGKFHEGRIAALGDLMRRIDADSTAERIADAAVELRAEWEHRVVPGGGESRDWESYRAGGVQALGEFALRGA
ncbi:hypothetical protein [Agromyces bauzanensis]|uniref:Uncharacterized protein n=1 Tax=Agromyces bauzanensis TaxID=1308924 RepID=A0A917UTN0_9MICO|nr:hypothetical protein [Agromyces bauzanensis]GGJ84682.1 hypothetical protein GCM10011372_23730 [Agromyces bauzanensis]